MNSTVDNKTTDRLRLDYINNLPQPFLIRTWGSRVQWPLEYIDAETGMLKFDVCGKLQNGHIDDVAEFIDAEGVSHDPDTFYREEA